MYSRDLILARNLDVEDEEAINSVIEMPPNEEEVEQVIQRRESEQRFATEQMFQVGNRPIAEEIGVIKESLLSKKGIVEERQEVLFKS